MDVVEGAVCRPNFSPAGRRRRRNMAIVSAVVAVASLMALVVTHASAPMRLVVFLPAAMSAVGFLQVTRNTCVARAMTGTFEHDDFSTTAADEADAKASRAVARTIQRDGMLIAAAAALFSAATAWIA